MTEVVAKSVVVDAQDRPSGEDDIPYPWRPKGRTASMDMTTKEKDELAVAKRKDKEGPFVELQVETDTRGVLIFLTTKEAVRLGNALIKAAQPKKQKKEGK